MRRVIVIGGSAGALAPLCTLLEGLDRRLPAAILSVIHVGPGPSHLDEVLRRHTSMRLVAPSQPQPVKAGRLYVGCPGSHLLIRAGCALYSKGPRENRHRPAIDTLFRTAARFYRSDVIAVLLSGALDDGSAGVLAVKARGGQVIIQDPGDARVPEMPANALRATAPDFCVPSDKISGLLNKLVRNSPSMHTPLPSDKACASLKSDSIGQEHEPVGLTCPDCGGAVLQIRDRGSVQFHCHVGHKYSLESFSEAHTDALERALWVALRRLNEQRSIQELLAKQHTQNRILRKRFEENAADSARDIKLLHEILARL